MANRLSRETSPYLLQHADNPVDWYPWGPEALERAQREDKPILLSIGYAACHWCHVMAHESFEDPATAQIMNELFVNVKVDREERPDLDSIYMQAVQAMTGHGGWPMTMFLTPDGVPFYGGTYFPPADRHGIPSFARILNSVAAAYRSQRGRIAETVTAMRKLYADVNSTEVVPVRPDTRTLEFAYRTLARSYDVVSGGFGGAPKFPPTMVMEFLLRYWRRTGNEDARHMVLETFRHMARGGIFDQLGGGFARYSVDARWIVPHFEKMLYDNALLIRLGARLYQATGDADVRRTTEETIEWARRELCAPDGAFYSSYDADSEGEEGLFYIWTVAELDDVLGSESQVVKDYFGVTETGNFEGRNILTRPAAAAVVAARHGITEGTLAEIVGRAREKLMQVRAKRVSPGRDDKIIASWNGLMARALADAAQAFGNDDYTSMSIRCSEFLFDRMSNTAARGASQLEVMRVMRTYNRGEARIAGFLEDHASLGLAAVSAYELTFDEKWLARARALAHTCVESFGDEEGPTFYDTAAGEEQLITRPRDIADNAIPSGTSLATELLLIVGEYFGDTLFTSRAEALLATLTESLHQYPSAFGQMLCAADSAINGTLQLAIVSGDGRADEVHAFRRVATQQYVPALIVAGAAQGTSKLPLLEGKTALAGAATAYLCRRYLCDSPTTSPTELGEQIQKSLRPAHEPALQ